MEVNRKEVRSAQGIEFTESKRPVQLREGIVGARNGQANGRIDGEPDVKAFGKSAGEMLAVQFRRVRSECDEKGDLERFHQFLAAREVRQRTGVDRLTKGTGYAHRGRVARGRGSNGQ